MYVHRNRSFTHRPTPAMPPAPIGPYQPCHQPSPAQTQPGQPSPAQTSPDHPSLAQQASPAQLGSLATLFPAPFIPLVRGGNVPCARCQKEGIDKKGGLNKDPGRVNKCRLLLVNNSCTFSRLLCS